MAKHSQNNGHRNARNAALVAAVGVGAAVLAPASANAAPVQVPNTNHYVNVPDEFMPHVQPVLDQVNGKTPSAAKPKAPVAAKKSTGQEIADYAMSKIGAPYVWGAAGPNAFDCSGLTSWAYAQAGKQIPRTSDAQAYSGKPVSLNALKPGDIVSYYGGASHVGVYIGNGKIVHALQSGTPVRVDDLHYMPVNNAVRF